MGGSVPVMTNFIKLYNGNYVNLDKARSLYANGATTTWWIEVDIDGTGERIAANPLTSEADAQELIRRFVQGRSAEDY